MPGQRRTGCELQGVGVGHERIAGTVRLVLGRLELHVPRLVDTFRHARLDRARRRGRRQVPGVEKCLVAPRPGFRTGATACGRGTRGTRCGVPREIFRPKGRAHPFGDGCGSMRRTCLP